MSRFLHPDAARAAAEYLGTSDPGEPLGSGLDGVVYATARTTAIKVLTREEAFGRELAVYQRLHRHNVDTVCGFNVPRLLGFRFDLRVIEMTIVRPPYILDFAKSTVDDPPDFPPEVMREWEQKVIEDFEGRWQVAMQIYHELRRRYGIYDLDINPRNVNFGDTGGGSVQG